MNVEPSCFILWRGISSFLSQRHFMYQIWIWKWCPHVICSKFNLLWVLNHCMMPTNMRSLIYRSRHMARWLWHDMRCLWGFVMVLWLKWSS
jgi:hypothetical protein